MRISLRLRGRLFLCDIDPHSGTRAVTRINAAVIVLLVFITAAGPAAPTANAALRRHPIVAAIDTRRSTGVAGDGSGIFTFSSDGKRLRRLTHRLSRQPVWSPDATKVMYATGYDNRQEIWTVRADGTHRRQVTHNDELDEWPSWAPGGHRFVVERYDANATASSDLFVVGTNRGRETNITSGSIAGACPDWAPDGSRIAFQRSRPGIISIRPNGNHVRRLTSNGFAPKWSPDSSRILFVRSTSDTPSFFQLFVMRRNGMDAQALTPADADAYRYSWSPDGKRVAVDLNKSDSSSALVVMRWDGTHSREIVTSDPRSDTEEFVSPTWSLDSSKIAYERHVLRGNDNRTWLWVVHSDGSHNHIFKDSTPKANELSPNWYSTADDCAIDSY